MIDLNLLPNEGLVLQSERVSRKDEKKSTYGDLYLTNLNLIFVYDMKTGFLKTEKFIQKYPVNQIKIVNGQVQAFLAKSGSRLQLQIYFVNGQVAFEIYRDKQSAEKKELQKWVDSISKVLIGSDSATENQSITAEVSGAEAIAETIKDTFSSFKKALGIKNNKIKVVTAKCTSCMAPVSGVQGQKVRCTYCGTEQTLSNGYTLTHTYFNSGFSPLANPVKQEEPTRKRRFYVIIFIQRGHFMFNDLFVFYLFRQFLRNLLKYV